MILSVKITPGGRNDAYLVTVEYPNGERKFTAQDTSDLLALWAIIPPEQRERHLVVTQSAGATENPQSWMANVFAGRMVAVVGDADETGQAGAKKWAAWIAKVAGEVRIVSAAQLGFEVAKTHDKDLRDWITA